MGTNTVLVPIPEGISALPQAFAMHGSKHSQVFRDPDDANRAWVVFDWDVEDYGKFIADPEVPAIFQEAGLQGPPVKAEPAGEYES